MIRWHAIGPWLPPAVLAADAALVWGGVLPLRRAVMLGIVLEILSWTVLGYRSVVGVRRYRRERRDGVPPWAAAECGLGELIPSRLARWILYEPKMWTCLTRWIFGRHRHRSSDCFAYHGAKKALVAIVVCLLGFETLVTHLLLLAIVGSRWWVWVLCGLDLYTLVWIVGFYASLVVRPHRLTADVLHLNYGYLSDLVIPRAAIRDARTMHDLTSTNGRLRIDWQSEIGHYTSGDATVAIELSPGAHLTFRGHPESRSVTTLHVTADDPEGFVAACCTSRGVQHADS